MTTEPPLLAMRDVLVRVADDLRLEGITLEIERGESVAMVVQHGRTTLLRVAAGLKPADEGEVLLSGRPIARALADVLGGPTLGFVFEGGGLLENATVFDNIALALRYHGAESERVVTERVRSSLEVTGIDALGGRFPYQLSRGQARLAALARALATDPVLVYIDDLHRGASQETWDRFLSAMAWARASHGTAFLTVLAVADAEPEGIDRLVRVRKVVGVK